MIRRLLARLSRGLVLGLVPGLLVIGAAGAHPAYATDIDDVVDHNGKCLSQENVGVVTDACDGTTRQDWKFVNVSAFPGDFLIRNDLTGDCLSILNNNTNAGAQVNTHTCDFTGGNEFEVWFFNNSQIGNVGDVAVGSALFMQPSGCETGNDLSVFMNIGVCNASLWTAPTS